MKINIREQSFSTLKCYFQGSHRARHPEETLAIILPYFPTTGLTRLSNITYLDRIGIPVTQAIRPNSFSLSVASGKGLTLEAALASAAMESLELYCAETVQPPSFKLAYADLVDRYPHIPQEDLPLSQHSLFQVEQPEVWCLGWDLLQHQEVAVPLEAAILDYRLRQGNWDRLLSFEMSSNGLASGNHLLEAITSGLYELVERDAITCYTEAQIRIGCRKPKVKLETIASPTVQQLLEQFRTAGLTPLLFDCSVDTEIPVYEVLCYSPQYEPISTGHGFGAHLDPEIAMIRALTEAAQTRAVAIAGTRDDFFQAYYNSFWLRDNSAEIAWLEADPPTIDAHSHSSEATTTFEADIEVILAKLQRVGRQQAIVVDLTPPGWNISVVRTIVPGLEGYRPHDYRPKNRANLFIQAQQRAASALLQPANSMQPSSHLPAGGI